MTKRRVAAEPVTEGRSTDGRFLPGTTGNAAGRPFSRKPLQTELIKVLALPRDAAPPDGCSGMVALAFKWRDMALLDGDTRALVEIRNTIDGLPRVDVDVDVNQRVTFVIGDFGEPVVINGMTSPISLPDFGDGDAGN